LSWTLALVALAGPPVAVAAQTAAARTDAVSRAEAASGGQATSPEPTGPTQRPGRVATLTTDASGKLTVRAVRLRAPLRVDGRLDEAIYDEVPALSDFIQVDPNPGAPASEKTEVWLLFDRDHVYIVARCYESQPERMGQSELRRDNSNIFQNDNFSWLFDTFHDGRNGILFEVTVAGGRADAQVTNERQMNTDWNPVWNVKTGSFEGGWTMEAALPFKSMRYLPGTRQVWGFQARRQNKWKNEYSFLTPVPAAAGGGALMRSSLAATLVGIEAPPPARNLEIKPYSVGDLRNDRVSAPRVNNHVGGDAGVDIKYGVRQGLTLDLTYNPDFAQADADEQQVNLSRFTLFFPEKREFFLENQGLFGFGGAATTSAAATSDTPVLFYSRRIGLSQGGEIPLTGGGRLTGRMGAYSIGLIDVRTKEVESAAGRITRPTNFGVVRLRRDVFRRSSIGIIATERSHRDAGAGSNQAYGADGTFGVTNELFINTFVARTQTDGVTTDDLSYRGRLDYEGDRYGVQLERLMVGDNFSPEVGFARRDNMLKDFVQLRFSPRPRITRIRKFYGHTAFTHVDNRSGRLETRTLDGQFEIQFQNSDRFIGGYTDSFEYLPRPFLIATGVVLPVAEYRFGTARVGFNFGKQRRISGNFLAERGTFYNGQRTALTVTQGRLSLTSRFTVEPTLTLNDVELRQGAFTQVLFGSRVSYAASPLAFVSALIQYNSSTRSVATNARLRWEYQPGSEVFVVYNEQRGTLALGFPELANRSVIVKVNRLFRF
jgi:Domain of unknown function (DUF5916)